MARWTVRMLTIPSICLIGFVSALIWSWGFRGEDGERIYFDFWVTTLGSVAGLLLGWKKPLAGGLLVLLSFGIGATVEVAREGVGEAAWLRPGSWIVFVPGPILVLFGIAERLITGWSNARAKSRALE